MCSLCISGDYEAAIREHQQELALSEVLNDVIGRAVASRKIGECYAEMGNIEAALKVGKLVGFKMPAKMRLWPLNQILQSCTFALPHYYSDTAFGDNNTVPQGCLGKL